MKRLWKIALCLALALIALTACSGGEQPNSGSQIYAEATQYLGPVAATETPTEAPQEVMDAQEYHGVCFWSARGA